MWTQDQDSTARISMMKVKSCITITQYVTKDHFILWMSKKNNCYYCCQRDFGALWKGFPHPMNSREVLQFILIEQIGLDRIDQMGQRLKGA